MRRTVFTCLGLVVALFMAMSAATQAMDVRIPHMMARTGENVKIPIFVEGVQDVTSVEVTLKYDDWVLDWNKRWDAGDLGADDFIHTVTDNPPGQLHIKLNSTTPVSGSGSLIELDFWVWCDIGKAIDIQLLNVTINGQEVDSEYLSHGVFQVGVSLSGR